MKTVNKAMLLLRQFTQEQLEIGLSEFARMTGEDKAVTRRLLVALMENGFIEQNPETRKYFLGSESLALSRLRWATAPMGRAAQVVARWLSSASSETVHIGVPGRDGDHRLLPSAPRQHYQPAPGRLLSVPRIVLGACLSVAHHARTAGRDHGPPV
ncbi:MAG: helix-turn-helix domain-containing protein [Rhodobacteraceae bacterium]|nr:helix-turn-helix domain-containing protein [Paracoccaceae bacterium]